MPTTTSTFDMRQWGRWLAGFVGFPLAGLAARAVAGPVDDLGAAIGGGIAAGVTLGTVQALALRVSAVQRLRWVVASSVGLGVGLGVGAAAVGYETDAASLVVMGAISGAGIGFAQALVLPVGPRRRLTWALATPVLWALGWMVTAQVIVDADRHHATFGASGALLVAGLGGLILAFGGSDAGATTVSGGSRRANAFDQKAVS